jgi:hypothetical protein
LDLKRQRFVTHGGARKRSGSIHPLYSIWAGVLKRCYSRNATNFAHYGGRGISVCDQWRFGDGQVTGFECFARDVGPRPSKLHSLDRIDNDGNYEPQNVRWASAAEQASNRRPRKRMA